MLCLPLLTQMADGLITFTVDHLETNRNVAIIDDRRGEHDRVTVTFLGIVSSFCRVR
jgi:hypothetical protein